MPDKGPATPPYAIRRGPTEPSLTRASRTSAGRGNSSLALRTGGPGPTGGTGSRMRRKATQAKPHSALRDWSQGTIRKLARADVPTAPRAGMGNLPPDDAAAPGGPGSIGTRLIWHWSPVLDPWKGWEPASWEMASDLSGGLVGGFLSAAATPVQFRMAHHEGGPPAEAGLLGITAWRDNIFW